jgi:hypothetical protein
MSNFPPASAYDRLVAIVRRELGALDVRVLELEDEPGPHDLLVSLLDGRRVVATFEAPVPDPDVRRRRLAILVESFADAFAPTSRPSRPVPAHSLHLELESLAKRAGAIDALVIDARSPMVWGASQQGMSLRPAYEPDVVSLPERKFEGVVLDLGEGAEVAAIGVEPVEPRAGNDGQDAPSLRAISAVRVLPELASLRRGGHLHHTETAADFAWVARSFASIYVLIVVFERAPDELRVERAISASLPTIERLVLALPPLDPQPYAGAAAIRRPRRRA